MVDWNEYITINEIDISFRLRCDFQMDSVCPKHNTKKTSISLDKYFIHFQCKEKIIKHFAPSTLIIVVNSDIFSDAINLL